MPLPVDSLTKKSSLKATRDAIGKSIGILIEEGRERDQAAAIAYETARKKTGRRLGSKS